MIRPLVNGLDARVEKIFGPFRGNRAADRVFYTATALGDFGLLWLAVGLVRIYRGHPGDTRAGLRAIIATGIESVLVNIGVKSLFKRRRPRPMEAHPLPFRQPITSSFPSGHATRGVLRGNSALRGRGTGARLLHARNGGGAQPGLHEDPSCLRRRRRHCHRPGARSDREASRPFAPVARGAIGAVNTAPPGLGLSSWTSSGRGAAGL